MVAPRECHDVTALVKSRTPHQKPPQKIAFAVFDMHSLPMAEQFS
jgi:hypothetical protein